MPPPRALPRPAAGELVKTATALPAWAQLAFPGTATLNRIQSTIFPVAFHSAENMLVCAPTGAGKTNCAMLALLQLVSAPPPPLPPPFILFAAVASLVRWSLPPLAAPDVPSLSRAPGL